MGPSAIVTALIVLLLTAGQQAKPPARPREPLLTKLLRIAGLTAAPSQMRGPADDAAVGNIWMVSIDRRDARALTTDGGYRSPIFLAERFDPAGASRERDRSTRLVGRKYFSAAHEGGRRETGGRRFGGPFGSRRAARDADGRVAAGVRLAPGRYGDRAAVRRR